MRLMRSGLRLANSRYLTLGETILAFGWLKRKKPLGWDLVLERNEKFDSRSVALRAAHCVFAANVRLEES